MKNILLINNNKNMNPVVPPIGLEFIASALLEEGYHVELYDLLFSLDPKELWEKVLQSDIVCITFRNLDTGSLFERGYYIDDLRRLVAMVKKYKDIKVILGGQGFSVAPEEILEYTKADYGIVGRGELAIVDLLKKMDSGPRIYNGNGYPIYSKAHRRDIIDYAAYVRYGASMGVVTNTGCPENCSYCVEHDQAYAEIELDNVINEVAQLYKYTDSFIMCDSEFNHDQEQSSRFMERLISEGYKIRYCVYLKPGRLEERFVKSLKQSGCEGISIGIDTMDDSIQKDLGRNATKNDIAQMFEMLKAYDLSFVPSFVCGFPWNDIDKLKSEIEFCEQAKADYISVNMGVRVYPHTRFTEKIFPELKEHRERFRGVLDNNESLLKPLYYIKDEDFLGQVCDLPKSHNVKVIGL
jgi:radical SAM superfamily enzyme YgiQ (UPF0313 family)